VELFFEKRFLASQKKRERKPDPQFTEGHAQTKLEEGSWKAEEFKFSKYKTITILLMVFLCRKVIFVKILNKK
jgi:hypothetical protein